MRSFFFIVFVPVALVASCSGEAPSPPQRADAKTELQSLVWVDRTGAVTGSLGEPQEALSGLEVSPDGQRVVVRGREAGNDDIYIHEGTTKTRFSDQRALSLLNGLCSLAHTRKAARYTNHSETEARLRSAHRCLSDERWTSPLAA